MGAMSDRVVQLYPYYLPHQYRTPQTHAVCKPVYAPATSTDPLLEVVREQGLAIKALQKAIHAPASIVQLQDLASANEKTAARLADHARAITEHTAVINRQAVAIEGLQHDGAVLAAAIVGTICIVSGRMMISALFRRKSAKPQTVNPSSDDIIDALLRSTPSRS